jgi:hypothetical protein
VTVRLEPARGRTQLTLEHIVHASDVDAHWAQFGPGAVGVGWDLAFLGLGKHLDSGGLVVDHEAAHAWVASEEGKVFMRKSADAWCAAHIESGEDPETARGMAERTAGAYTGG